MKKNEVRIGGVYDAKVTNKIVPVRIESESPYGGWDATNLITNKRIRVKSAQRLRGEVHHTKQFMEAKLPPKQDQFTAAAAAFEDAGLAAPTAAEDPDRIPITKLMAKPAKKSKPKATPDAPSPDSSAPLETPRDESPRQGKTSGLDAAYQVLRAAGQAMAIGDVVAKMLAEGMWQTGGKTPAATIYSAIIREIKTKNGTARFRKVSRGHFESVENTENNENPLASIRI